LAWSKSCGRRAAELHGRIDLALDAVVGFLAQLGAPRLKDAGMDEGLGRQEVVHLEGDFLSLRREGGTGDRCGNQGFCKQLFHLRLLFDGGWAALLK
jgi:hypothetical protein